MQIDGYENYEIYETGEILNKKTNKWIKISTRTSKTGYKQLYVCLCKNYKFKSFIVARLLMQYYSPEDDWDSTKEVDHIDGDSTNNKLENLRMVTRSQNCQNTKCSSNNKLGIKNIRYRNYKDIERYEFTKRIDGKTHSKKFKTLDEAIKYKDEYINKQNNKYIKK
tara:strand:+ start:193 stop:690 length:498 start_codon:yes stop_codon:yes gene_type:complete